MRGPSVNVTAARAAARLRLSWVRYVGLSRDEVERLRSQPRPVVAGGDPAAQWGRADVLHYEAMRGGGAQRLGGMGGD